MTRPMSPLCLVFTCWGLTGLLAACTLAQLDRLDLVHTFMQREAITADVFGTAGLAWILLGLLAYAIGDLAARFEQRRASAPGPRIDLERMARMAFLANLALLAVTALWILSSAAKVGGLVQLAANVYVDSLTSRQVLLENKLFTGMRLFYAALPATACLAAALLATVRVQVLR